MMHEHVTSLLGYTIDGVVQDDVLRHYIVIWGRKKFWKKSIPIMQICTHSGVCSDVYNGTGNSFSYEGLVDCP